MSDYESPKLIRVLPMLLGLISCFMIFLLPPSVEKSWACLMICLITAGSFFAASSLRWSGKDSWKWDCGLGILWLVNAWIHLFVLLAVYLPKPE